MVPLRIILGVFYNVGIFFFAGALIAADLVYVFWRRGWKESSLQS